MTTHDNRVPSRLRDAVSADLRPVRALPSPAARALVVVPLGLALLVAAPTVFSWRIDLASVGWTLSWGASVAQMLIGFVLVALALRESVPGRGLSAFATAASMGGAAAVVVVITLTTAGSTRLLRPLHPLDIGEICFLGSFASGVPVVAIAGLLAGMAFPLRPGLVGALYGLGAGLMADAGWRLFCEFSSPRHVFPFHLGAIIANMLLGIAWATMLARTRVRRN